MAQCLSQMRHHIPVQIYVGTSKLSQILFFSQVSSTLFKTTSELFQFGLHLKFLIRFLELVASSAHEIYRKLLCIPSARV